MNQNSLDLSRFRHDLRTPINQILGYCEMVMEDPEIPASFQPDLERIREGGRQLLVLIGAYFNEATFADKQRDLHQLCHDLRTPVNHIVGYSEMLQEQAEESGQNRFAPDLQKIHSAAINWLALMEEYLIPPQSNVLADPRESIDAARVLAEPILQPGFIFQSPTPSNTAVKTAEQGNLLIVDDDAANRDMLTRRLQRQGYFVTAAETGLQALQIMRTKQPDLVLLDLIMPGIDGYQVLVRMKGDPALRHIPVIMVSGLDQQNGIARCIEAGAEDYLTKPFNSVFLRARIGACLEKKQLRDQEQRTYQALVQSQKVLAAELAEAAAYVISLLPAPLAGPIATQWQFHPSTQLGGDSFGYHWLDPDHFVIYLLDVCGHGVGAALLSVSVLNVLRSQSLPGVDFSQPAQVLAGLNRAFSMEQNNNMFFTLWFGVFCRSSRDLSYASGGHPPALLFHPVNADQKKVFESLSTHGPAVGVDPDSRYIQQAAHVAPNCSLVLYSDGVYEIQQTNGQMWSLDEFIQDILAKPFSTLQSPQNCYQLAMERHGLKPLEDDYSLLQIEIN